MTAPEFLPEMVEAAARAIVGPWLPVPYGCRFTLDQMRDVRWRRTSPQEQDMARAQALAVLHALHALVYQRVPDGCVVVPMEPTQEQLTAAFERGMGPGEDLYRSIYRAMLAAAPRAGTEDKP